MEKLPDMVDKSGCQAGVCKKHGKLYQKIYCEMCQTRLCVDCVPAHKEHALYDIKILAENAKKKLEGLMSENKRDRVNLEAAAKMASETVESTNNEDQVRTKLEIKNLLRQCFETVLQEFDSALSNREILIADSFTNVRQKAEVIQNEIVNLDAKQEELNKLLGFKGDQVISTIEKRSKNGSLFRTGIELSVPYLNKSGGRPKSKIETSLRGILGPKFKESIEYWLRHEPFSPDFDSLSLRSSKSLNLSVSLFRSYKHDDKPRMKASNNLLCLENNDGDFDRVEMEMISSGDHSSRKVINLVF